MKLLHIAFTEITNYNAKALFYTSHGAMSGAVAFGLHQYPDIIPFFD